MKVGNKIVLKKIFTSPLFWTSTVIIILFPILIHILFKIPGCDFTVAIWSIESILEYGSTIIGSLIVYFTVVLTLTKNQEENEKLIQSANENNEKLIQSTNENNEKLIQTTIKENQKIINNSHNEKKFEYFSNSASKVLLQLNKIIDILFEYTEKAFDLTSDLNSRKPIIDKMNTYLYSLETSLHEVRLFIPENARFFFNHRFFDTVYSDFKVTFGYIYTSKTIFDTPNCQMIDWYVTQLSSKLPELNKTITKVLFLISDYYYDESLFKKREENGQISFEADEHLKDSN